MTDDRLIVEFAAVFDDTIAMRVVRMPTWIERGKFRFDHDGTSVRSLQNPELSCDLVCVGGRITCLDAMLRMYDFDTAEYRDAALARYRSAVDACNRAHAPRRKVQVERWLNVYASALDKKHAWCHFTKESADKAATPSRIACVRLTGEYEEPTT